MGRKKSDSRKDTTYRQVYEDRERTARSEARPIDPVTHAQFRQWVGQRVYDAIGCYGMDDEPMDGEHLQARYACDGGLTLFLTELFPASTSRNPYGPYQLRSIATMEQTIRHSGCEQLLEPRSTGKSARTNRAVLWALLFGRRKSVLLFQSNAGKARHSLDVIKSELLGNPAVAAMFPQLVACCKHAAKSTRLLQTWQGVETQMEWTTTTLGLPNIAGQTYVGGRVAAMPFGSATGAARVNPQSLADQRPDLLVLDDPQSADAAMTGPGDSEKMMAFFKSSIAYLGGRGKAPAIFACQTIFAENDFAHRLSRDPMVHSVRYPMLVREPKNHAWWMSAYKDAITNYDPDDPQGAVQARRRATQLYLANRKMADEGSEVAWQYAYDPDDCASALEAVYRNRISSESAFMCQDQNDPTTYRTHDDLRCRAEMIVKKQHPEARRIVPDWATKLTVHVDLQDSLLFWMAMAGNETMQAAIVDYQSWPANQSLEYSLRYAPVNFNTETKYANLPTTADKIRAALNDLLHYLRNEIQFVGSDGQVYAIDRIGIDSSDGQHTPVVHKFCRDSAKQGMAGVYPVRGWAQRPGATPMMERKKNELKREVYGDHWCEKTNTQTRVRWIEVDVSYWKRRLHEGLRAPIGTSTSVSIFNVDNHHIHHMLADHCNSEAPVWMTATRSNDSTSGCWAWELMPNRENHRFDNAVGCLALLNHAGARYSDVVNNRAAVVHNRIKASELQKQRRAERAQQIRRRF